MSITYYKTRDLITKECDNNNKLLLFTVLLSIIFLGFFCLFPKFICLSFFSIIIIFSFFIFWGIVAGSQFLYHINQNSQFDQDFIYCEKIKDFYITNTDVDRIPVTISENILNINIITESKRIIPYTMNEFNKEGLAIGDEIYVSGKKCNKNKLLDIVYDINIKKKS